MGKIIELRPDRVVWCVIIDDTRQPDFILSEVPGFVSVTITARSWDDVQPLRSQAENAIRCRK